MTNEQKAKRHEEIVMFIRIVRLVDFQYPFLLNGLKREMKMRMNTLRSNLHSFLNILKTNMPDGFEENSDNDAAGAWEVLYEYSKAENKPMFLAICKAYNEGGITSNTEQLPVNSPEFAETLQAQNSTM